MLAVSENKESIHLKDSVAKRTRNHMVEPRSRHFDEGISAIQGLEERYAKRSKEKFAWYAAVDYDMDAESIATQWKILPEKTVPAIIMGWQLRIVNGNQLKLEPILQHTEGSSQDQPST